MAPTRMKLRVRRRDSTAGGSSSGAVTGGGQGEVEQGRNRERSRKKTTSPPPTSTTTTTTRSVSAEEASPDSKCPICLDRFNNLAYLDSCLHRFCFPCIQEWSNNKAECPLCKQPFSSILHSVRAENDFKEYTLRPAPSNGSVAATAAMVAAMATAARNERQMRILLRRRREGEGARRRRERGGGLRERGGRGGGGRGRERRRAGEWYLAQPPPPLPHPSFAPVMPDDEEEEEEEMERAMRGRGEEDGDPGVIFEGLTGLGGAVNPLAPNDRSSRRLMGRLAARRRLQREGGTVRRLREREILTFRRALYRTGVRVRGVTGVNGNGNQGQQSDITAEGYRRNPALINRLRPWLRRELTVLYGAHGSLVDIVQRIITSRLARHGLEDTATIEEELRPFLLVRTDHFLHELVSFARSQLSLENYDLQAVYEPSTPSSVLEGNSSTTDDDSVIAISEGEEEEGERGGGGSEEREFGRAGVSDVIQTESSLSLSVWDDETPGPSYSTAEPSHSPRPLSVSPGWQDLRAETTNQEAEEGEGREADREDEEGEECLIVGFVKPMAERTPELVQLSSDTEEEEEKEKKEEQKRTETLPPLPSVTPSIPPSLPLIPSISPSTSNAAGNADGQTEGERERSRHISRAHSRSHACSQSRACSRSRARSRSWSDILNGSGSDQSSVCLCSPASPKESEGWRDRERDMQKERERRISNFLSSTSCPDVETDGERRRRRGRERRGERRRRGKSSDRERSGERGERERRGASHDPNPSIYSAVFPRSQYLHSQSPSPLRSGSDSHSPSPSLRSPPDSPWEYRCSDLSSVSSSPASHSVPSNTGHSNHHHGDKPGGKRKYKSRHLEDDPTWQPSVARHGEKRRDGEKEREKEREKRGREKRRERGRRDYHREKTSGEGESSKRRRRESRSPSVEIIYEGTVSSAAPRPHRKHQKKRHRRKHHNSSAVVITIDSDSNDGDPSASPPGLSNARPINFSVSDLPPLPLVDSGGMGVDLGVDISELPVDILDQESDRSGTELDSQSQTIDPVGDDDSDKDVGVESGEGNCRVLEPNNEDDDDDDDDGIIDKNREPFPKDENQAVTKPVRKSTTASNQTDRTTCHNAATVDRDKQPDGRRERRAEARECKPHPDGGRETEIRKKECNARWERGGGGGMRVGEREREVREREAGFGAKDCNTLQDREKETEGADGEAGVATSDTRLLATILNDLEGIADRKPDHHRNSDPKGTPSLRRGRVRSRHRLEQCALSLDSLGEERKEVSSKDWDWQQYWTSTPGSGKERFRGLNLNPFNQDSISEERREGTSRNLRLQSWSTRAGPSQTSQSVPSDHQSSPSTSKDSDKDFCQIVESPPPPDRTIRGNIGKDTPPPPPLHRFKDGGLRGETDLRSREIPPPVLKQRERSNVSPISPLSLNRNTPPLLKHKDAGSPASDRCVQAQTSSQSPRPFPISSIDLHSPPVGARSAPFSSHSPVSPSSVESRSVSVISPVDLRSDSSSTLSKDKQPIPPISTLKRHLASALALREDRPSTSGSCALISPIDVHPTYRTSPVDLHSSNAISHSERWPKSDVSSRFRSMEKMTSCLRIAPVDSHQAFFVDFHSSSTASTKDGDTYRVSLNERAAPARKSPIDSHSSSAISRRERLSESDISSRVEKEKVVPGRNSPVDSHPTSPKSSVDFHSSSAVSDRERLLEKDLSSSASYKEKPAPSCVSPIDSHSTSQASSIDFHSSSAVCTTERHLNSADVFPTHRHSGSGLLWPQNSRPPLLPSVLPSLPPSVESQPSLPPSVDSHPSLPPSVSLSPSVDSNLPLSKLPIESTAPSLPPSKHRHPTNLFSAFSTTHRDYVPNSKLSVDSHSKSQLSIDSHSKSPLSIDSYSKSSSTDGGVRSQPRSDYHSKSSPFHPKKHCNYHSSFDRHFNAQSPIDSHSNAQSPVDVHSGDRAVLPATDGVWNERTHSAAHGRRRDSDTHSVHSKD